MNIQEFIKQSYIKDLIHNKDLKPQEVYLLLHLIYLSNKKGEITISNKELMNETGFTNSNMIIKYIQKLILNGYIDKELGGGAKIKNSYKINMDFTDKYVD